MLTSKKNSVETLTSGYRYSFNGMEKDDEVKGSGNSYTTEFRQYDPRIGRWLSLDPRMEKYPEYSGYSAFANNPICILDQNGDTIARFDNAGNYIGWLDDGKTTWTGRIEITKTITNADGSTSTVEEYQTFVFNDPENVDVWALRNERVTSVQVIDQKYLDEKMKIAFQGQDPTEYPITMRIAYFLKEGKGGGNLDMGPAIGLVDMLNDKSSFYVVDGVAYNIADFGNFLLGYAAGTAEISLTLTLWGAEYNHFTSSGEDINPLYKNIEPNGDSEDYSPGIFDADADQKAIEDGHNKATKNKK